MNSRPSARLVGAFVMLAVGLAVAGVIVFGSGQLFRGTENFVIYFEGSLAGLNRGAPVKYRGVQIGTVTDVLFQILGSQRSQDDPRLPVIVELDEQRLMARGSEVDLGDAQFIDSLIDEGLRAHIAIESFVTGRRYVELGEFPGTPFELVADPAVDLKELPSITPDGLTEIAADAQAFLANLAAIDLGGMVARLTNVVEELGTVVTGVAGQVSDLAGSPALHAMMDSMPMIMGKLGVALSSYEKLAHDFDTTFAPMQRKLGETLDQATVTLGEIEATFGNMQMLITPGSPFAHEVQVAFRDFGSAARAFKDLAEYLQRNPSAILRGKPGENR